MGLACREKFAIEMMDKRPDHEYVQEYKKNHEEKEPEIEAQKPEKFSKKKGKGG
jgi:hypothetical protein